MNIDVIQPFGYCLGVTYVINSLLDIRNKQLNRPIAVIGDLIHNERTITELKKLNITFLNNEYDEQKNFLMTCSSSTYIIFPAHGHLKEFDNIVNERKLESKDLICPILKNNLENLKSIKDEKILYIGDISHIEGKAFKSFCKDSLFFDYSDVKKLNKTDIYAVFNQSTILESDYEKIINIFINNDIQFRPYKNICKAPYEREENLVKMVKNNKYDYVFIVGSPTSNNTNKLLEIYYKTTKMNNCTIISSIDDLKKYKLNKLNKILIGSGTSASKDNVLEIINYLNSIK